MKAPLSRYVVVLVLLTDRGGMLLGQLAFRMQTHVEASDPLVCKVGSVDGTSLLGLCGRNNAIASRHNHG